MESVVRVQNLSHAYGERKALDGVSFEVGRGQLFCLVGPNGGGKSTTFNILATLLRPQGGEVRVLGEDALAHPERVRARLGVTFQSPALDKKLTVAENLRQQGALYGLNRRQTESRSRELLQAFGLADRSGDRAETLSGGLKRRLEIAKGMLHDPAILILDEPTTALDPGARRQVWDQLLALKQRGITLLVTTHLLEEAEACDQVALLDGGHLVAVGAPEELRSRVGEEIIAIRSREPARLQEGIRSRFALDSTLVAGEVRIARSQGAERIGELFGTFRDAIESLTVAKPTLEDFYISATGRRYEGAGVAP